MRNHADAEGTQGIEEALRIADARHGVHPLAGKGGQRARTATHQRHRVARAQAHRPLAEAGGGAGGRGRCAWSIDVGAVAAGMRRGSGLPTRRSGFGRVASDGHGRAGAPAHCFGLAQVDHAEVAATSARGWLAQWPGRQHAAIAVAACAIDHLDLDVATEPVMLQAVIADHDVAPGLRQRPRGGDAVAIHPHRDRQAPGDQHRLIAADVGRGLCGDPARGAGIAAAIAATGHAGAPAGRQQPLDKGHHHRRLAGTAGGQVAHHHHRHVHAMGPQPAAAVQPPPQCHRGRIQRCQRTHRPWHRCIAEPPCGGAGRRLAHGLPPCRIRVIRARVHGTACRAGGRTGRRWPSARRGCRVRPAGPGPAPAPGRHVRWWTGDGR